MLQNETAFDFADLFLLCMIIAFAKTVRAECKRLTFIGLLLQVFDRHPAVTKPSAINLSTGS